MRSDIVPGTTFPDYELSDHRGTRRTLSELQGGDPIVLVLSRGGFSPKERRQHDGLVLLHREMEVGEQLRLDFRSVLQRCRPDWDITSDEHRNAWAQGDKARFYPYGKTQAQVIREQD